MRSCPSFAITMRSSSASPWIPPGVIKRSPSSGTSIFRCSPTSIRKARSQKPTARIARTMDSASAPSSSSMAMARFSGAIARRSRSIRAPTAFSMRWSALSGLGGSRPAAVKEKSLRKEKPMSILRVPVTSDDHIAGKDDGPATLVEYGDYECPACGATHPVVNHLRQHFGDELRFVFRHFPLTEIHPNAESAAEAAEFAAEHDRFWQMHEAIYDNQEQLGAPLLIAIARELRLPEQHLEDALLSGTYAPPVRQQFLSGVRSGVNATPTFFINNRRHDGDFGFVSLAHVITDAVVEAETRIRTAS